MNEVRDIRELAQRAELEFHENPKLDQRKWRPWWLGVCLSITCLIPLVIALCQRNHEIYSAGPLSEAHAFIANDCRQCHSSWQPLKRLASLDSDAYSSRHSSIDNHACIKCHAASDHHPNQIPAHHNLSCASCHSEHKGQHVLAKVTDKQCLQCHQDLKSTGETSTQFAAKVTGFDAAQGHPEFYLWRRLASSGPDELESQRLSNQELAEQKLLGQQSPGHPALFRDALKKLNLGEVGVQDSKSGLRDRTELKFNHATHFKADGVPNRNGTNEKLAQNCQLCHVTDSAGQYLLPVNYESHCSRCHALWFDKQLYPNDEVPHERLDIVRGYLTEKYTLAALHAQSPAQQKGPPRLLPGFPVRPTLAVDQARQIEKNVAEAEKFAHQCFSNQQHGGCQFCHTVEQKDPAELPQIVKPDQPERWFLHSRFDHSAHRMLKCVKCHEGVTTSRPERESARSQSAGDILLPKIAVCQECHISPSAAPKRVTMEGVPAGEGHQQLTISSSCTMCHTYHRRDVVEDKLEKFPNVHSN